MEAFNVMVAINLTGHIVFYYLDVDIHVLSLQARIELGSITVVPDLIA